jgi:F-type H+-transporting ATPase subunit epsilon
MNETLDLVVLTPDKKVLETSAQSMRVLLPDGWWGILPGHSPMISYIDSGIVHYETEGVTRYIALYQGTVEVQRKSHEPTCVNILTAAAEEGEDLEAVKAALEQQAERLQELAKEANREFNQIRLSLEKSLHEAQITEMGL